MTKKISTIKTLIELGACDCRWPVGDPRDEGFHFCGAQQAVGRPYCEAHWNVAFVPSKSRTGGHNGQPILPFPVRRAA